MNITRGKLSLGDAAIVVEDYVTAADRVGTALGDDTGVAAEDVPNGILVAVIGDLQDDAAANLSVACRPKWEVDNLAAHQFRWLINVQNCVLVRGHASTPLTNP